MAGASQELDVDQCRKQRLRRDRVEAPQPLHLRLRQTQTRDLERFGENDCAPLIATTLMVTAPLEAIGVRAAELLVLPLE